MVDTLITPAYRELNRRLHGRGGYGLWGNRHAADVLDLARRHGIADILDYGCGQGSLKFAIDAAGDAVSVREYDPAIDGKDAAPEPADG